MLSGGLVRVSGGTKRCRCGGAIILLIVVVILLLLAFCRPLLILQSATDLSTMLPSTVGCCVGAPLTFMNRRPRHYRASLSLSSSPRGGRRTSDDDDINRRDDGSESPVAVSFGGRRRRILLSSLHRPPPSAYLSCTASLDPRMLSEKSSCCSIAERTSNEQHKQIRRVGGAAARSPSRSARTATE